MTTSSPNSIDAAWLPFTANRQFKSEPRMIARGQGMYYYDPQGRELLDGLAGLWCSLAGHGQKRITDAVTAQMQELDFAPTFQFAHPKVIELSGRIAAMAPRDLDRVFFCNSGSEAADTALKIALAYQKAIGQAQRVRLVGRERGYHGVGFGGMSVGGIGPNRKQFGAMLPYVDHLPHTHLPAVNRFCRGQPEHGVHLAESLESLIALHGDTIAAVMVEPVAGSTGVLVPPQGYLQRLKEICTKNGILLIFDEVITGFGRIGTNFGAERLGVTPDIMTMAKGLTNAAVPMGAVATTSAVHDAIVHGSPSGIELFHGYTYSGHPLASAAAIATLELHRSEDLPGRAKAIEPYWQDAAHAMRDVPGVVDVREMGLIAGIELEPRKGAPTARALDVFRWCFDQGVLVRVTGDIVALSPPLIIENHHVDRLFGTLSDAIRAVPA